MAFPCNQCEKCFSRLRDLTDHENSIHKGLRYRCPACSNSFIYRLRKLTPDFEIKHPEIGSCLYCGDQDLFSDSHQKLPFGQTWKWWTAGEYGPGTHYKTKNSRRPNIPRLDCLPWRDTRRSQNILSNFYWSGILVKWLICWTMPITIVGLREQTWAAPKIWVEHLSKKFLRQVWKSLKKALKTRFLSKFCRGT